MYKVKRLFVSTLIHVHLLMIPNYSCKLTIHYWGYFCHYQILLIGVFCFLKGKSYISTQTWCDERVWLSWQPSYDFALKCSFQMMILLVSIKPCMLLEVGNCSNHVSLNHHVNTLQYQNCLFTLKVTISKNFHSPNHLALVVLTSYSRVFQLGIAYCLHTRTRSLSLGVHMKVYCHILLRLSLMIRMTITSLCLSWPSPYWGKGREKVVTSNNQVITAMSI